MGGQNQLLEGNNPCRLVVSSCHCALGRKVERQVTMPTCFFLQRIIQPYSLYSAQNASYSTELKSTGRDDAEAVITTQATG